MTYQDFFIRIAISFLLSFFIGLERQWRRRSVGLRTNVLVSIGAFLFVSFSIDTNVEDISRIAAQVVSGIGFLGAGVIIKDKVNIKGLNTAATLWCSAAIGILCAAGLIVESIIGTTFILISNILLRYISFKLNTIYKPKYENYRLKVICEEDKEIVIRTLISQSVHNEYMILNNLENTTLEDHRVKIYATFLISTEKNNLMEELINRIVIEPGVFSSGWKKLENSKHVDEDEL